ncbi:MAG: protein kinase [Blastocatellia bacterium]|nr:protein kinase [Blastocatellia bacterium]
MTPERWQQIEEIFHEASDLDGAARVDLLDNKCADDDELRVEVERLLSQYEQASSFIEQPIINGTSGNVLANLLDESDADPMTGKVLGSYRIEREIGRGGMGAVYEAVRADGEFRLRVAVKVVKRGVDTDFVLRRFRNERQILAALDHQFITRLIDGGTTDDGRPFFVMEYIDGLPLYRYCDREKLSLNERLQLFSRICEAVEYAHQRRVIHRDLKPSNIFITNDGNPRLLDFGIAKLLDPDLAIDTLQPTATALRMMTVDYASPEQIRGDKVTFATDVYSLGVILFELLTGYRPYSFASRSPHDVARTICDEDPLLPSGVARGGVEGATPIRVNPNAETLSNVSIVSSQGIDAADIEGNLDRIILQALKKDPADRYSSVEELRLDILSHIDGGKVAAAEIDLRASSPLIEDDPDSRSVAVLPLTLLSPTGEETTGETYLTVGVADAIITRLTNVQRLTVRPTSSITRYSEREINPFRAGEELGVDYVLDGRIRRFGERIRISLQLLDVRKVKTIWAGHFDEHLTDVLELEDAISEQVATALIPHLTGEDREKLSKRGTNDPLAYEAYLRGRFHWNQFTSESLPKALEAYSSAIAIDPRYAPAHAAIAEYYIWAGIYGLVPTVTTYRNAWDSVHRALSIDQNLAEAHAAYALLLANEFRWDSAEESYKRSIALNPKYALAREWYAAFMVGNGRFEEGIEQMLLSEKLDPMSLRTKVLVAWYYYQCREYELALKKADEIIAIDPNYPQGHLQRGNVLSILGRHDEAIESLTLADRMMPSTALVEYPLCLAYQRVGRTADAERLADAVEERARTEFVKPYFIAMANLATGRIDRAFDLLDVALEERDAWLIWLGTDPNLDVLRDDKRYSQMLRATGREMIDGRVHVVSSSPLHITPSTSLGSAITSEAVTEPLAEQETKQFRDPFLRRHRWKFVAACVFAVLVAIGMSTGVITVYFNNAPKLTVHQVGNLAPRSIAVLPFENDTGDPANDYIADGMTDVLTARISGLPDIKVLPRSSVSRFKRSDLTAQGVGLELGVERIVNGELTKQGDKLTLKIEMVNVIDGKKVLSLNFAEQGTNILDLQEVMTAKVADALASATGSPRVVGKSYTTNNEAFSLYLKGEFSRQKGTPAGVTESIEYYKKAIEIDPNYALAYQGLALVYRTAPAFGTHSPQDAYPAAKTAALKALEIDPSLGSAHVPLASIKFVWDWDFAGAEVQYKEAIRLAPNNSEAHSSYGNALLALGRFEEALNELRIAQQLDPPSLTIASNIGWALYISGRLDEAETQTRQVLERDPNFARAYLSLGEIYVERGRFDDAIIAYQKSRQIAGDPITDMALGHVYGVAGRSTEARKVAVDLENKVLKKEVSAFLPAVVYAGLNDKDKAFYWLERAYQERSNWLTLAKVGRRLKNLRGDPRFDDLIKRIGM